MESLLIESATEAVQPSLSSCQVKAVEGKVPLLVVEKGEADLAGGYIQGTLGEGGELQVKGESKGGEGLEGGLVRVGEEEGVVDESQEDVRVSEARVAARVVLKCDRVVVEG